MLDRATQIRKGEELDLPKLERYLLDHLKDQKAPLYIQQFPGGFSNLTYLLKLGETELVLRRPPLGANIKSAHDMGREYRVLSQLSKVYDKAPTPYLYCDDVSVIGSPFYVMERVCGVILRKKEEDLDLTPSTMTALSGAFTDTLVELHAVDPKAAGLGDLGKPKGYISRQVAGWSKRYLKAKTDDLVHMDQVAAWLADNQPPMTEATLIHNDYKYDNVVLDPNDLKRVIAVLDWEMTTLGDPLMDLGGSLAYWVEPDDLDVMKATGLTCLPGNYDRRQLVEHYSMASGRNLDDLTFYYAFGNFKLAVIGQQIYTRYKLGLTQDPRFEGLIHMVRACAQTAARAIELGRIDRLFS